MSLISALKIAGFAAVVLVFTHDDEDDPDLFTVAALFALHDLILDD